MSATLLQALTDPNAKQVFAEHCGEIHQTWKVLLEETTLPDNTTSTDSPVLDAIKTLDNEIKRPKNTVVLRLAYVQLIRVLAALTKKVQNDRKHGLIVGKRSKRNATVVVDIYLSATGRASREEVHKLASRGNRWTAIAGRYPLLLFTLTDVADRIVNKTRMPNQRLKTLAEEISRVYPTALIAASEYLAKDAESVVRSGLGSKSQQTQDVLTEVTKMLI